MSLESFKTIECPGCGKKSDVTVWQSLNGNLNSEAKEKLLNGNLFTFICPDCGYRAELDYQILYHDMKNHAMIYYVAEENVEECISMFNTSFGMESAENINQSYVKRIVTSKNSLREKAIIFDCGLDDRVIELIKIFYLSKVKDILPGLTFNEVYFMPANDGYQLHLLGEETRIISFTREFYDGILKDFGKLFESDNSLIIDSNWVFKLLTGK